METEPQDELMIKVTRKGVPISPCDHCERMFPVPHLHPVIALGYQSYCGHIITNRPGARRVPLCSDCYTNLINASVTITGMSVQDDEEAIAALARLSGT